MTEQQLLEQYGRLQLERESTIFKIRGIEQKMEEVKKNLIALDREKNIKLEPKPKDGNGK